jgi:hypothetical protein
MLREFFVPFATLCVTMFACVCSIHQLCLFHQIYLDMAARLESEQWLVQQCEDPNFFSKMHTHTDLCFIVNNHARVGALMLALREFTQGILASDILERVGLTGWACRLLFSWSGMLIVFCFLLLGPSWVFSGVRGLGHRWPQCREGHFKDA